MATRSHARGHTIRIMGWLLVVTGALASAVTMLLMFVGSSPGPILPPQTPAAIREDAIIRPGEGHCEDDHRCGGILCPIVGAWLVRYGRRHFIQPVARDQVPTQGTVLYLRHFESDGIAQSGSLL